MVIFLSKQIKYRKGKQTSLCDYGFPKINKHECIIDCPVLKEGIVRCCKDCIKYPELCHRFCNLF